MPKTLIQIEVEHKRGVAPEDICGVLNQLINVGLADAADSAADPNIDNPQAELATELTIGEPTAVSA